MNVDAQLDVKTFTVAQLIMALGTFPLTAIVGIDYDTETLTLNWDALEVSQELANPDDLR
jgi:uncharacterized membrane protein